VADPGEGGDSIAFFGVRVQESKGKSSGFLSIRGIFLVRTDVQGRPGWLHIVTQFPIVSSQRLLPALSGQREMPTDLITAAPDGTKLLPGEAPGD